MGIELLTDSTTAWEWYIPHNTLYTLTIRQRSRKLLFGKSSINLSPHYFPFNPKFTNHPLHLSPSLSLRVDYQQKTADAITPTPLNPVSALSCCMAKGLTRTKQPAQRLQNAYTSSLVTRQQGSDKAHWKLTLYPASSQSRQSL